jgi:hypothetical protein
VKFLFSFVRTDNSQTSVRLINRFGEWKSNQDSIQNRMPYLGQSKSLLTTNEHSYWHGPGSVITDSIDLKPAAWIYPDMYTPGTIWYWLNEDDCDSGRKPGNESSPESELTFFRHPKCCVFHLRIEYVF